MRTGLLILFGVGVATLAAAPRSHVRSAASDSIQTEDAALRSLPLQLATEVSERSSHDVDDSLLELPKPDNPFEEKNPFQAGTKNEKSQAAKHDLWSDRHSGKDDPGGVPTVAPVPEPASIVLLASFVVGTCLLARRRIKSLLA